MAKKASENIKYYKNESGPTISTVLRNVIEKDGLTYKDIDGTGEITVINDWHNSSLERAKAIAKRLSIKDKCALLFISDWRMGKYPVTNMFDGSSNKDSIVLDESGVLDEGEFHGRTIFGEQDLPGTSTLIKEWGVRHTILRDNATARDIVDYTNQLHVLAEECDVFIPVEVVSNSRNENGDAVFGMNDASGVFAAWPGTLGIAAAVLGSDMNVAKQFAYAIKNSWDAVGLKKGYMYMADVVSDPRWQRTAGTFGEDPKLISDIFENIMPLIQGDKNGITSDGVAMTVKHFPGGGARENGFDPHYKKGQWNVYATPGSLDKYHLAPFKTAIGCNPSSIMPYYAKPSKDKSADQGIPMDSKGFAYNDYFINDLLMTQLGFEGYINSDTGIIHNMCWGVEELDEVERIAYAINKGSVSLISGLFDHELALEAIDRKINDYYNTHRVPDGYAVEDITLNENAIDKVIVKPLAEMFELGMFDNPFRDAEEAEKRVFDKNDWDNAYTAHQKSVTLLKNENNTLPIELDNLDSKKVYARVFRKNADEAKSATDALRKMYKEKGISLTDDYKGADIAIFMLNPASGAYFNATPGYLELDLCENKSVCNTDEEGKPTSGVHSETTLAEYDELTAIAEDVRARGGKVIMSVNITMAWQLGNVEKYADALMCGYDTYYEAILDVITGEFNPVGKLPLTLPRGDEVLKVDSEGKCISPNDVPGFDKDKYMPDDLKDENGKAYAYRDSMGNYYEYGFGLNYI